MTTPVPPASRPSARMLRRVVAAVVVAALLLAAWVAAGPWLAVRGIERALEQRDTAALQRHVDFPRLRANLKAQIDDRLVRAAGPDAAASLFGSLALATVGGASRMAVDALATPTGIELLLQGHAVWQRVHGRTLGADAWAATEPARPLRDARLRYHSLSRFTATVTHADGQQTVCVLQRQGLRWKLVDIRLPGAIP